MPSLKPFTAPPRSLPMLRSFLVPKISTTTSRTISQCQMLSPPMVLSFAPLLYLEALARPRKHRPEDVRAADDVDMQMHYFLPADVAGVDDRPVTVGRSLLARQGPRQREQPPEHTGVIRGHLGERVDVPLRYQHEMHRRLGTDVLEAEDLRVLVHLGRRYFAARDLAENALVHECWPACPLRERSAARLTASQTRCLLFQPRHAFAPRQ